MHFKTTCGVHERFVPPEHLSRDICLVANSIVVTKSEINLQRIRKKVDLEQNGDVCKWRDSGAKGIIHSQHYLI